MNEKRKRKGKKISTHRGRIKQKQTRKLANKQEN
jgi:hypothetical protein